MNHFNHETIWIIGASSGIGEALAKELHAKGAKLILSARRKNKLKDLQKTLGTHHDVYPMDLSNSTSIEQAIDHISTHYPRIDRIIYLAALYDPLSITDMDMENTKTLIHVNLLGAMHISKAMIPILEKQDHSQVVLCASSAGYTGLKHGQPYSASKAALINFTESLHLEAPQSVDIKLINSGFVDTDLTKKNNFAMPSMITPEKAATYIAKGLVSKHFEIHFPKRFTITMKIISWLPYRTQFWIKRKL